MKKNKKQLNEFSLTAILAGVLIFAWVTGFFNRLADNVDALYHGRSVQVQRALKKILKNLSNNNNFLKKIDNYVEKNGVGSHMINHLMELSDVKSQLSFYEKDSNIDYDELIRELKNVLTNAMYEEAKERGITTTIKNKVDSINW
jgi:hypothetical protein